MPHGFGGIDQQVELFDLLPDSHGISKAIDGILNVFRKMTKLPSVIKNQLPKQFWEIGWKIYSEHQYQYLDFIRNAYTAQFPGRKENYWAIVRKKQDRPIFQTSCSCEAYLRNLSCPHIAALFFIIYSKNPDTTDVDQTLYRGYEQSLWLQLAKLYYEHFGVDKLTITAHLESSRDQAVVRIIGSYDGGHELLNFILAEPAAGRIIQKYRSQFFSELVDSAFVNHANETRFEYLEAEKTDLEIRMNISGYKSWQQKFEESYWFDFSKAWFLEFDDIGYSVEFSESNQAIEIFSIDGSFIFYLQKALIPAIIKKLAQNPAIRHTLSIAEKPAILNYSLTLTDEHDLKITPVIFFPDDPTPHTIDAGSGLQVIQFGDYLYVQQKGFFLFERKVQYYDSNKFSLKEVIIPNDDIIDFIHEYGRFIDTDEFHFVSPTLKKRKVIQNIKSIDLFVDEIQNDWLYLSVKYRTANETIPLYEIYLALRSGKRYLITKDHWIDLYTADFSWLQNLIEQRGIDIIRRGDRETHLMVNKLNFLRLNAQIPPKGKVETHQPLSDILNHLVSLKPLTPAPSLKGRKYQLREYQKNGYEWLWFLYENQLSGLLCDDMGLGKTYQSIALIDGIMMQDHQPRNFLIVCPTSVLPHWHEKLGELKKKVNLILYYGGDRTLIRGKGTKHRVVLTSYGILRNDLEKLAHIPFEVAIFDEIQTAKNKASLTNAAVNQLNSKMRIGLTGTPIENNLAELKALFDIILPDYLGSDAAFRKNYIGPIERQEDKVKREQLQRLIQPFILRRTKIQVLEELPPKIEEIRKCELSEEQVKRYQEVLNTRAKMLLAKLYNKSENIPYIHIFAVLNLLKQICNHPAQLEDGCLDYNKYPSGKWDLFCELLEESLNSGFKVVVFSQYLNMLGLIEAYLKDNRIEFATIKGATKNRKEMIDRFNNDPNCKVFTGSLRASGLGINLTGGSVVIHYDRWWNAAREDQATDRVYRIGQTRGVQVLKLVTEGTLEDKIDRMIQKKKKLMEDLVKEDDASIIKNFDREELIDLLTFGGK